MSKSEDKLNDIFDLPKQIKQEFNNEIVPELVSPKPVINETELLPFFFFLAWWKNVQ